MLRANPEKIDAVLFTHEHADHTAGLDDIRPFFFRQGDIDIYAHSRVLGQLQQRFEYIFTSEIKYPGVPNLIQNEVKNELFSINGLDIIPIEGLHYKLPVF